MKLKELNGMLVSINMALLVELADILCSVSFGRLEPCLNAGKIQDPNGA